MKKLLLITVIMVSGYTLSAQAYNYKQQNKSAVVTERKGNLLAQEAAPVNYKNQFSTEKERVKTSEKATPTPNPVFNKKNYKRQF